MSNYPNLTDGKPFRQTTKRSVVIPVVKHRFINGTEMRYVDGTPQQLIEGSYQTLTAGEYKGTGSLQDFHDSVNGGFGGFNLTFNGITYSNMYFAGSNVNRIMFSEESVNLYSTQIMLKQVGTTVFPTVTVSDPSLPTLGDGTTGPIAQWPSSLSHLQSVTVVDLPDSVRFAYKRFNNAIPGGILIYNAITDAELAILEAFWLQVGGSYGVWNLVYNGISYFARFDTDSFVIDYSGGPGYNRISLPWIAVPLS